MQLIQDTYAAFQESLFSRPDPRMADLQPFADTFLRLFQAHQYSRRDNEPISSLTLQYAYQVQQMVIAARTGGSCLLPPPGQKHPPRTLIHGTASRCWPA